MSAKLNIGIIGAGRIGKMHIENIANNFPHINIKTISHPRIDEVKPVLINYNIDRLTNNSDEIFSDPDISAVMIFSSTDSHAELCMKAAKAGKHIFCEKPIAHNLEKTKEVLNIVKKAGVKMQIGFNRRFDHNHMRLKELINTGTLGKPYLIKITSYDSTYDMNFIRKSAKAGGIIFDMTVHDFDLVRCLMAAYDSEIQVDEIYASAGVVINEEFKTVNDHDTVVVILKFKNGSHAVITNTREAVYGYDQRIEVLGSKGSAIEDNDVPTTVKVFTKDQPTFDKIPWFFMQRYAEAFKTELRDFFSCILENRNPLVTGEDDLYATVFAEMAKKSLLEKRPIKLSDISFKM